MKKVLLFAIFATLLLACKKDDPPETSIYVVNHADEYFTVYIDGTYKGELAGSESYTWDISPGSHTMKATENNWILIQDIYTETVYVDEGGSGYWSFGLK